VGKKKITGLVKKCALRTSFCAGGLLLREVLFKGGGEAGEEGVQSSPGKASVVQGEKR